MQTFIPTEERFIELLEQAVERSVTRHVPEFLRKATRKEYLTVDELSALTGWSRRTIQYLRDSRQLPYRQDGRRILFRTDEIEKYLESKKVSAREKTK